MFVVSMISPTGFPTAMAVCGGMDQACSTLHKTGGVDWNQLGDHYRDGIVKTKLGTFRFSITECELTLLSHSVFRD